MCVFTLALQLSFISCHSLWSQRSHSTPFPEQWISINALFDMWIHFCTIIYFWLHFAQLVCYASFVPLYSDWWAVSLGILQVSQNSIKQSRCMTTLLWGHILRCAVEKSQTVQSKLSDIRVYDHAACHQIKNQKSNQFWHESKLSDMQVYDHTVIGLVRSLQAFSSPIWLCILSFGQFERTFKTHTMEKSTNKITV